MKVKSGYLKIIREIVITTASLRDRFSRLPCALLTAIFLGLGACSSNLPSEHHDHYAFPSHHVYLELPTGGDSRKKYEVLGWVKSKAEYPTFQQAEVGGTAICVNYFNKAAADLLAEAIKAGGEAVIKVRSVVLTMDGKFQEFPTPECSDDGSQGEILLRGIAIRYLPVKH